MCGHVAQVGKEDDALLVTAQLGQRQIAREAVTLESTTHQLATGQQLQAYGRKN